jgi:hypothetical protein
MNIQPTIKQNDAIVKPKETIVNLNFNHTFLTERIIISAFTEEGCEYIRRLENTVLNAKGKDKFEIVKQAEEQLGITVKQIICYGDVTSKPPKIFKDLCEKIVVGNGITTPLYSYKCFVGLDSTQKKFNLVMHEDVYSSWLCAMSKIGYPTHAILYSIRTRT